MLKRPWYVEELIHITQPLMYINDIALTNIAFYKYTNKQKFQHFVIYNYNTQ